MLAVAIVPIKVIRNKPVHSASDAAADPGFQHLAPMRIIQASPILAHAANAVCLVRDWHSRFVLFQQINGISHRLRAEQFFIPLIAIKAEESARTFRSIRIADEKFHVHVADHLHAAAMQLGVEPGEPITALAVAANRKVRGIAATKCRVRQTPEVRAVKTDLRNIGFHVVDERQIAGVRVTGPMGDETRKLNPFCGDQLHCRPAGTAWMPALPTSRCEWR